MKNSPDIEWALELLERVNPEATRIIQSRLEERPNIKWAEDLKEAAEIIESFATEIPIYIDDQGMRDLANRLKLYVCEIIGVNTFLDS